MLIFWDKFHDRKMTTFPNSWYKMGTAYKNGVLVWMPFELEIPSSARLDKDMPMRGRDLGAIAKIEANLLTFRWCIPNIHSGYRGGAAN